MKRLRLFLAMGVLTMTLATVTAVAGQMPGGITSPPPPPPDSQVTSTGEISTGVTGQMTTGITGQMPFGVTATDPVTDGLLNLLQSLLSLF